MRFSATALADALGASLHGPEVIVGGLAIDSRALRPGQLFAALRAERDGHEFVPAAVASGAGAVLVDHLVETSAASGGTGPGAAGPGAAGPGAAGPGAAGAGAAGAGAVGAGLDGGPDARMTSLVVDDVSEALFAMARLARTRLGDPVIGVTGSVGKTTTKDLLASVLEERFVTAASQRSFNNELGVPLTLCNAPDDVQAVVVEMGARGAGHISLLCELARPTVGVVTTVEGVHTEVMGDLVAIARAKGELIEALPADGLAVLNAAVPLVAAMAARSAARVVTFGDGGDVTATDVRIDSELRPSFRLHSPWGDADVRLSIRGVHNVANALAAAAVALGVGVSLDELVTGLAAAGSSPWRMDLRRSASGLLVLNDSYNAGPASVAAALQSLASLDATRKVAVLGVMAELGSTAEAEHRRIASLADSLGIEVIAVDTDLYGAGMRVDDVDAAVAAVAAFAAGDGVALDAAGGAGDRVAVLVKGSRVAGLERVAEALLAGS